MCFSYVRISKACFNRLAVLSRCHVVLAVVDCVLMVSFRLLVVPGCSWWSRYWENGPNLYVPGVAGVQWLVLYWMFLVNQALMFLE